jgi:myotubularin-related protein 9
LVAQCLDQENLSVLAHGSDGTDTTLAVTSITQVILNPDCRSIRGFEALIEREWLQGGYPFGSRHFKSAYAHTASSVKNPKKKYAPTFLLFMDCVWQLFYQFPCSFEFTENFLITILEHSYASQFGTFLGDNVWEREQLNLHVNTVSLWSHINRPEVIITYMNPVYEPNSKVIWPSVAPASLSLWSGLFLRWVVDQKPTEETWKAIAEMKEKEKELKKQAIKLRKQLMDMEKALNSKMSASSPST